MFHYMFNSEFVTLVSLKVPSGGCRAIKRQEWGRSNLHFFACQRDIYLLVRTTLGRSFPFSPCLNRFPTLRGLFFKKKDSDPTNFETPATQYWVIVDPLSLSLSLATHLWAPTRQVQAVYLSPSFPCIFRVIYWREVFLRQEKGKIFCFAVEEGSEANQYKCRVARWPACRSHFGYIWVLAQLYPQFDQLYNSSA